MFIGRLANLNKLYILTIKGHEDEGAYAVNDDDGERALYMFENQDDATRYGGLLEAEDYPPMSVVDVEEKLAIQTCEVYNYRYTIITAKDFVIPPKQDDTVQKN